MGYLKCQSCGNSNRDTDKSCYSCEAPLDAGPGIGPPAPPGMVARPVGAPPPAPERGLKKLDRDSTWSHGLRAGAAGGAVFGLIPACFGAFFGAMLGSLGGVGAAGVAGVLVFAIIWGSYLVEGILLGLIVGSMNVLCYGADCAKIGWWFGMAWGLLSLIRGDGSLVSIIWSGAWGAALGATISWAERALFRKQMF